MKISVLSSSSLSYLDVVLQKFHVFRGSKKCFPPKLINWLTWNLHSQEHLFINDLHFTSIDSVVLLNLALEVKILKANSITLRDTCTSKNGKIWQGTSFLSITISWLFKLDFLPNKYGYYHIYRTLHKAIYILLRKSIFFLDTSIVRCVSTRSEILPKSNNIRLITFSLNDP